MPWLFRPRVGPYIHVPSRPRSVLTQTLIALFWTLLPIVLLIVALTR